MSCRLVLWLSLTSALLLVLMLAFCISAYRETTALDLLFDGAGEGAEGLVAVTAQMESILSRKGPVDNLFHFLSKEPGRKEFIRLSDRKRARLYLSKMSAYVNNNDWPEWTPEFVGAVEFLFSTVMNNLLPLLGLPNGLLRLIENRRGRSVLQANINAIKLFSNGKTSYSRENVREFLVRNRRFKRLMKRQDKIWAEWSYMLQKLSTLDNWKIAASFAPHLEKELNELRIAIITADIHRRTVNMLSDIPVSDSLASENTVPGINWWPAMSFYKNLPELNGNTADDHIFFIRINMGYQKEDNRTSGWLIAHKAWLIDFLKSYFSNMSSRGFSTLRAGENYSINWKIARIKAEIINYINSRIILDENSRFWKAYGLRELVFTRINILNYQ